MDYATILREYAFVLWVSQVVAAKIQFAFKIVQYYLIKFIIKL